MVTFKFRGVITIEVVNNRVMGASRTLRSVFTLVW